MVTMNITIDPPADRCSTCGADYENMEHPLKPGVIMMRTCKCEMKIQNFPGGQIIMMVPPKTELK